MLEIGIVTQLVPLRSPLWLVCGLVTINKRLMTCGQTDRSSAVTDTKRQGHSSASWELRLKPQSIFLNPQAAEGQRGSHTRGLCPSDTRGLCPSAAPGLPSSSSHLTATLLLGDCC